MKQNHIKHMHSTKKELEEQLLEIESHSYQTYMCTSWKPPDTPFQKPFQTIKHL